MHYERMTEQFVLYNDDHYEGSSLKEQLTENGYMIKCQRGNGNVSERDSH